MGARVAVPAPRTVIVTPPAPAVTWADADVHLRLDGDVSQKAYVEGIVAAVTGWIDGPGGWLGRAIMTQTLEYRTHGFGGRLRLLGPVASVESVTYVDSEGDDATVDPGAYALTGNDLALAVGQDWPAVRGDREGVRIRYVAGEAEAPAPVKHAILLMTGHLYEHRGASPRDALDGAAGALLAPYRVWTL